MKLITRDTDYALRALFYIARHKERIVPASELVRELKIPRPFLRKILQLLNKKGILKSHKGQGGGFLLEVSANKIFLVDLIKIFQGPFHLNECAFKKLICPNIKKCSLKEKMDRIERYVVSQLKCITVKSLLRQE